MPDDVNDMVVESVKSLLVRPAELAALQNMQGVLVVAEASNAEAVGLLEEKGLWSGALLDSMLRRFPRGVGCRLLWSRICFCTMEPDVERVSADLSEILESIRIPGLASRCALVVIGPTPNHEFIETLGRLEGIVGTEWHFAEKSPDVHKLYDGHVVYQAG
jgi:hypothetical protein